MANNEAKLNLKDGEVLVKEKNPTIIIDRTREPRAPYYPEYGGEKQEPVWAYVDLETGELISDSGNKLGFKLRPDDLNLTLQAMETFQSNA